MRPSTTGRGSSLCPRSSCTMHCVAAAACTSIYITTNIVRMTSSHVSRISSNSCCVSLYPGTSTAVFLVTFSQRSLFKKHPTCFHTLFCIFHSSSLLIIINISADITPYQTLLVPKKGIGSIPSVTLQNTAYSFFTIFIR